MLLVIPGALNVEQCAGVTCFVVCTLLNQAKLGVYQSAFKDTDL